MSEQLSTTNGSNSAAGSGYPKPYGVHVRDLFQHTVEDYGPSVVYYREGKFCVDALAEELAAKDRQARQEAEEYRERARSIAELTRNDEEVQLAVGFLATVAILESMQALVQLEDQAVPVGGSVIGQNEQIAVAPAV